MERSSECDLGILETLSDEAIQEITETYDGVITTVESLIAGTGDLSVEKEFMSHVSSLSKYGLDSLVHDHFLRSLEEQAFKKSGALSFWEHNYGGDQVLCTWGLEEISRYQKKCLSIVVQALQPVNEERVLNSVAQISSRFQSSLSSTLMTTTLPQHFPETLHWYFKEKLEELSAIMDEDEHQNINGMDLDASRHDELVTNIRKVVRDLSTIGFTSMAENAYASAIFSLVKAKVHDLAGDDYRTCALGSIKEWIQFRFSSLMRLVIPPHRLALALPLLLYLVVHLQAFPILPKELLGGQGIVRWKLRLEYFAYETLQNLRAAKLFEIIVDCPESSPAIEDLKQCLEFTGQHSKLVESFISSLKYRLLTAGASTNDILHQYVSTIKALRAIDPAGVLLEAVSEPIRDYLRGRSDTIKCIVNMLTDGSSGGNANGCDTLLDELTRHEGSQENAGFDDDFHTDDKQAWINASRWEPDPVDADPLRKGSLSQRKVDILGMLVDIVGSKEKLVTEYRVLLAEKLLKKTDYDIDTEIRTVELLKIHFGEASMQRCEIMLNDLIDSKRVNTNIKRASQTGVELGESELSDDILTSTILSTNFWPPIQDEPLELPAPIDKLLSDYANRYHETKTPRKLLWKKNLGTVKLELQFGDRAMQFTVSPTHAAIIMQFQEKKRSCCSHWNAHRRIKPKSKLVDKQGTESSANVYTLVESITDTGKKESEQEVWAGDEESGRCIASVEDQLRKEMTICHENFIMGMLTNSAGRMALEQIHNYLKMFCVGYDKSLQQLQSFLSGLVAEEKLEFRDGMYLLKIFGRK